MASAKFKLPHARCVKALMPEFLPDILVYVITFNGCPKPSSTVLENKSIANKFKIVMGVFLWEFPNELRLRRRLFPFTQRPNLWLGVPDDDGLVSFEHSTKVSWLVYYPWTQPLWGSDKVYGLFLKGHCKFTVLQSSLECETNVSSWGLRTSTRSRRFITPLFRFLFLYLQWRRKAFF